MNYFELYPGDYLRDTADLALVDHGAYLQLMLAYYGSDSALPAELAALYRIARAMTKDEQKAVDRVASRFFPIAEDGERHNARIDREIEKAQRRIAAAQANGKKGGSPQKKAGYNERGFIYAIQRVDGGPIKVGISKYPQQRYSGLRSKVGPITELALAEVADMGSAEAAIHKHFDGRREGEWLAVSFAELLPIWQAITQPNGASSGQATTQTHHTPLEDQKLPTTSGAEAPPADPIWGTGLDFLLRKGLPKASARSFLGLLRKELHDDLTVAELLLEAERQDISNPQAWLTQAAKQRKSQNGAGYAGNLRNRESAADRVARINAEADQRNGLFRDGDPDDRVVSVQ